VSQLLDNPVYHALISGDAPLSSGEGNVKFFDEEVSPFAGFPTEYDKGFDELYHILPPGRKILYATTKQMDEPFGWQLKAYIQGVQFVYDADCPDQPSIQPVPLDIKNVDEMVQLAVLTKPGPFGKRTIDFGSYYGIFEDGQLAAMTGQRLHVANYTEVSAVCTHPRFLGRGYATALLQHQLNLICRQEQTPFLHVREDNARAIAVYERLGFKRRGPMHFYFLQSRK
jgi:ribosomal protein S18 acetylase RimI-like enzyme